MSLPWFPFNIKDFVTNTLRLNTEAKGAYLMLILDYYQTETAPPDDDEVLAAITGLSIETWKRHRRVIAPLFEIKDGKWHHERVQQELLEGHLKHSKAVAKAQTAAAAASAARALKAANKTSSKNTSKVSMEDKTPRSKPPRNLQVTPKDTSKVILEEPHKQTQILDGGGGDARAREADPVSEVEGRLPSTQPVSMGVPIDHWTPDFVHPADLGLLNEFCAIHEEKGTFSKDWPTLWQRYLDEAKTGKNQRKRTVPPRIETDKRPEQPVGTRIIITEEAFALAAEIAKDMGVEGLPITVGMPSAIQTWMASWSPDTIRLAIQKVMARRPGDPPGSMKYFENAIAREHAERQRPLPVAKIAPAQEIVIHGKEKPRAKSVSAAARDIAAEFAALTGRRPEDGDRQGDDTGGSIPQIGRG